VPSLCGGDPAARRSGAVSGLLRRLDQEVSQRLEQSYAPKSKDSLRSALNAFARFARACPERELLKRPAFHGDIEAAAHNEWTFILFVWFMVTIDSPTTGKPVKPKTVDSYVSLLKGFLSFKYTFDVLEKGIRLKKLIKDLMENDPLGGGRKKRPGLRRHHLVRALAPLIAKRTGKTVNEINDAAAVGTAWHSLARGGELAPGVKPSAWRAAVHPTRADLTFGRSRGRNYAMVMLRPLKKRGRAPPAKVPQYIEEHDGSGSDVYFLLRELERVDPVPEAERASTPLFRRRTVSRSKVSTSHLTVRHLRSVIQQYAKTAGRVDWQSFGGHSARIGGATDLAERGTASEILLRAKGRWASDIGAIYARLTRRALLAASRLMQRARARDMEEILPNFVQPGA
jgi:hypothetical protein